MTKAQITQIITLIFVIAIITILVIHLKNSNEIVEVGDEAYDFTLEDMNGEIHQLSNYKGKPVVLNFFSTWCESCHEVAPSQIRFEKEFGDDVHVFTIVRAESKRMLDRYIERHGKSYGERKFLFDYDMEVSERFGVVGQPETIIIDENGIVIEHIVGPVTGEEIKAMMSKWVNS